MNDLKAPLEGVVRLFGMLDTKLNEQGGLSFLLSIRSKLEQSLSAITETEIQSILAEMEKAEESLKRFKEELHAIRHLKQFFRSPSGGNAPRSF